MNWNPKEKLLYIITKYECSSLDQWIRYIHEVMFITTSEFTQNPMKSLDVHVYTFLFCCSVITYHPCSMVCWWGVSSHCCLLLWLGCHQSITSVNSQEIQSIGICLFTCHHLFITSADCHSWLLIAPICLVRGGCLEVTQVVESDVRTGSDSSQQNVLFPTSTWKTMANDTCVRSTFVFYSSEINIKL